MKAWKWETFENIISEKNFSIGQSEHLSFPVKNFFIKRDENLQIIIETSCKQNVIRKPLYHHPVGTVYQNEGIIEFKGFSKEFSATAYGVNLREQREYYEDEDYTFHESAFIHKIQSQLKEKLQGRYLIEWLVNVDDNYIWPDLIKNEKKTMYTRTMQLGQKFINLREKNNIKNSGFSGVNLSIDNVDIYFGICREIAFDKKKMPGFIFYDGQISGEMREKIRLCISFVLGRPLVYLGHTVIDESFDIVSFEAITPYIMCEKVFKYPSLPPAPLHKLYLNTIDKSIFSVMVNALYSKYFELNFKSISWSYWHSIFSASHIGLMWLKK